MIESNIGRDGWVAALGGGVVGDLAGFAARRLFARRCRYANTDNAVGAGGFGHRW